MRTDTNHYENMSVIFIQEFVSTPLHWHCSPDGSSRISSRVSTLFAHMSVHEEDGFEFSDSESDGPLAMVEVSSDDEELRRHAARFSTGGNDDEGFDFSNSGSESDFEQGRWLKHTQTLTNLLEALRTQAAAANARSRDAAAAADPPRRRRGRQKGQVGDPETRRRHREREERERAARLEQEHTEPHHVKARRALAQKRATMAEAKSKEAERKPESGLCLASRFSDCTGLEGRILEVLNDGGRPEALSPEFEKYISETETHFSRKQRTSVTPAQLAAQAGVPEQTFRDRRPVWWALKHSAGKLVWSAVAAKVLEGVASDELEPVVMVIATQFDETPITLGVEQLKAFFGDIEEMGIPGGEQVVASTSADILERERTSVTSTSVRSKQVLKIQQTELQIAVLIRHVRTNELQVVRGYVPLPLQCLDRNAGECILAAYRDAIDVPGMTELQGACKVVLHINTCDRATGNLRAERFLWHEAQELMSAGSLVKRWRLTLSCDVHRCHSVAGVTLEIVSFHVSSLVNFSLALRPGGSLQKLKAQLGDYITSDARFVWHDAPPPEALEEAMAYRKHVLDAIFDGDLDEEQMAHRERAGIRAGDSTKESKVLRRHTIERLANSDWRLPVIHHWCPGRWCCTSGKHCRWQFRNLLVDALLPGNWPMFQRYRWAGSLPAVCAVALLTSFHCVFQYVVPAWHKASASAAASSAAASEQLVEGFDFSDSGREDDIQPMHSRDRLAPKKKKRKVTKRKAPVAAEHNEQVKESDQVDWAKHNEQLRGDAARWASEEPNALVMVLLRLSQLLCYIMFALLHLSGSEWDSVSGQKSVKGEKRRYRLLDVHSGKYSKSFARRARRLYESPEPWEILANSERTQRARSIAFKMISRACCATSSFLELHWMGYPYKLFSILSGRKSAKEVSRERQCFLDDFSRDFLAHFDSLAKICSIDAVAVLMLAGELARNDIARIESRHSAIQARARLRSANRKPVLFSDLSGDFMGQRDRIVVDEVETFKVPDPGEEADDEEEVSFKRTPHKVKRVRRPDGGLRVKYLHKGGAYRLFMHRGRAGKKAPAGSRGRFQKGDGDAYAALGPEERRELETTGRDTGENASITGAPTWGTRRGAATLPLAVEQAFAVLAAPQPAQVDNEHAAAEDALVSAADNCVGALVRAGDAERAQADWRARYLSDRKELRRNLRHETRPERDEVEEQLKLVRVWSASRHSQQRLFLPAFHEQSCSLPCTDFMDMKHLGVSTAALAADILRRAGEPKKASKRFRDLYTVARAEWRRVHSVYFHESVPKLGTVPATPGSWSFCRMAGVCVCCPEGKILNEFVQSLRDFLGALCTPHSTWREALSAGDVVIEVKDSDLLGHHSDTSKWLHVGHVNLKNFQISFTILEPDDDIDNVLEARRFNAVALRALGPAHTSAAGSDISSSLGSDNDLRVFDACLNYRKAYSCSVWLISGRDQVLEFFLPKHVEVRRSLPPVIFWKGDNCSFSRDEEAALRDVPTPSASDLVGAVPVVENDEPAMFYSNERADSDGDVPTDADVPPITGLDMRKVINLALARADVEHEPRFHHLDTDPVPPAQRPRAAKHPDRPGAIDDDSSSGPGAAPPRPAQLAAGAGPAGAGGAARAAPGDEGPAPIPRSRVPPIAGRAGPGEREWDWGRFKLREICPKGTCEGIAAVCGKRHRNPNRLCTRSIYMGQALRKDECILRAKRWLLWGLNHPEEDDMSYTRHTRRTVRSFDYGPTEAECDARCAIDFADFSARLQEASRA